MYNGQNAGAFLSVAVSNLLSNMIWFVLGMAIAFGTLQKYFARILGSTQSGLSGCKPLVI